MPLAATGEQTQSSETSSGQKYTTCECSNITVSITVPPELLKSCGSSCAAFLPAQSPSEVNSKCCQDAEPGPRALNDS